MRGIFYIDKNNLLYHMLEGRNFRKALWGYHPSFQNIDIVTN